MARTSGERDWMWLPDVALASVLSYLISLEDYIRFSVVCKQWHSVAKHETRNFMAAAHKQAPLLLLPPRDSNCQLWSVYHVTQKRLLDFKLSVPTREERHCYRSSHGWLVFAGNYSRIITLFNPFTQSEINLPPVNDISEDDVMFIHAVVLSADPSLYPTDYIVAIQVIRNKQAGLALIRPGRGGKYWTYFFGEHVCPHCDYHILWGNSDIIFDKSGKWVYANGCRGMVVRADVDAPAELAMLELVAQPWNDIPESHMYLVTLNKDLLMISRLSGNEVKVFKLQEDSSFVEVFDLNGDAVFIGHCGGSLVARDFPSIEANCVYYKDEYSYSSRIWKFSVKDKMKYCFDNIPVGKWKFDDRWFWVSPRINL